MIVIVAYLSFFLNRKESRLGSAKCGAFSLKTKLSTKLSCYDAEKKFFNQILRQEDAWNLAIFNFPQIIASFWSMGKCVF